MRYKVIHTTDTTVNIWDGSRDPDHPEEPAGTMTMSVGLNHGFQVGDIVALRITLIERAT